MSGFYDRQILPWLIHAAMKQERLRPYRQRALASARGDVLELGIGSGLNLPGYGPDVTSITGIDPSERLLERARRVAGETRGPVRLLRGSAEALPLPDASVDTVVSTWVLCSIPDLGRALAEVRRVLKPGGRFVFVEHGRAPSPGVSRWQERLTPAWRRCAGGCHLNRPIAELVEEAGFSLERIEKGEGPGPRLFNYTYEGVARREGHGGALRGRGAG